MLVANVQGKIYERLYCPEAIRLAEDERWNRAKELVDMLSEVERFMAEATVRIPTHLNCLFSQGGH